MQLCIDITSLQTVQCGWNASLPRDTYSHGVFDDGGEYCQRIWSQPSRCLIVLRRGDCEGRCIWFIWWSNWLKGPLSTMYWFVETLFLRGQVDQHHASKMLHHSIPLVENVLNITIGFCTTALCTWPHLCNEGLTILQPLCNIPLCVIVDELWTVCWWTVHLRKSCGKGHFPYCKSCLHPLPFICLSCYCHSHVVA